MAVMASMHPSLNKLFLMMAVMPRYILIMPRWAEPQRHMVVVMCL